MTLRPGPVVAHGYAMWDPARIPFGETPSFVLITGTTDEDQTLTADTTNITDPEGLGPFTYQWQSYNGSTWDNIVGATASTLLLDDVHVGLQLRVQVFYTDGESNPETVTSSATAPIGAVNDAPSGVPTITGTVQEDSELTCVTAAISDPDGLGTFAYRWQYLNVSWNDIGGATAVTFTPGDDEVGRQLRVVAEYTDGQGFAESIPSAATVSVVNVNDTPSGVPTISGTVQEDETLTALTGAISDDDGLGTFSYQWQRFDDPAWNDISGATSVTFVPVDAQVGLQLRVQVAWTDGEGTPEEVTSAATVAVVNVNDPPSGVPTITGTVQEDSVLTANTGSISDDDTLGSFSYQWQEFIPSLWTNISGATAATYTPGDTQVGRTLRVKVSYTDGHGTPEEVISAATVAVVNVNDPPVGIPTITGTVQEDSVLTASGSAITDDDGLGTFTWQWQVSDNGTTGWANISGATAITFTPLDAQVAKYLRVQASYTDGHSTAEGPLNSAATVAVVNVNDAPGGSVTFTGTEQENEVLTGNTSAITDDDGLGSFTYQWQRNTGSWANIAGATAITYTLVTADVGNTVRLVVSYTDGHGTGESVTSAASGTISAAAGGNPTLLSSLTTASLLTSLDLCLDAGDTNSYGGTGQTFTDVSGDNNDFALGATSGSSTDDPTFNGTAGDLTSSEYFSFDGGDFFEGTVTPPPSPLHQLHFSDAEWSMIMAVFIPTGGTDDDSVFWIGDTGSRRGVVVNVLTAETLQVQRLWNSGPVQTYHTSTATLTANAWNVIGVALHEGGGTNTSAIYINGTTETFTATNSGGDGTASDNWTIFSRDTGATRNMASGSRFGAMALWGGRTLSTTQLGTASADLETRFGV